MLSSAGNSAAMARQTTTFFFERSELQLGENTIIQIQVDTDGMTSVNLSGGNLSAMPATAQTCSCGPAM